MLLVLLLLIYIADVSVVAAVDVVAVGGDVLRWFWGWCLYVLVGAIKYQ